MENSSFSKMSTTNNNHGRNYTQLDIKEKIKILHKINSNNFQKYSFDKSNNNRNQKKNINLLSSTLPSSVLAKNNVYKKKLVKNNSSKNSPNICVLKNSKSESKSYNKEKIMTEIKNNENLRNSVKIELKNEIIEEFLEDIANIDEKNVINFLKIKNLLVSSEKIKKKILPKYSIYKKNLNINKDISKDNSDIITNSKNNIDSSEIFHNFEYQTDKKKCLDSEKRSNKIMMNNYILDEIDKKDIKKNFYGFEGVNGNKRCSNTHSPVKTIFNNLFINNNEKYIIRNPFHEHENRHMNNIKRRKLFIQSNAEIQLSNFNFEIINNQNNLIKTGVSSNFEPKGNKSFIFEKDKSEKEKTIKKNKTSENFYTKNDKKIKYCFHSTINKSINKQQINANKRYSQYTNITTNDNKINNNSKIKEYCDVKREKEKIDLKENKHFNNIKRINLKTNNIKIEDEKRKKLIKKIIEDSKKILKNKSKANKFFDSLFIIKKNKNKNKLFLKNEILNKSVITRKNKNIRLHQINIQGFYTYTDHKERNKTFSNFLNNKKSNMFRICHIKSYLKSLKKENNNNKQMLNTKWLKNISKKSIPLLCFDKK